jgi:GntR family transcriptional regulator, rspAB operon transcriptional repressor
MAGLAGIDALDGPRTVEDLVLEKLRRLILESTLQPGQRLKQEEIAARLGVSKTPVQHAFKRLQVEGYVTGEPHRSVIVAPLSADEVEELYVMRIGLERLAARLATPRLDRATVDRLRALNHRTVVAAGRGDMTAFLELDRELHLTLYEAAGRPSLVQRIAALREQCERYMRTNISLPGQVEETVSDHVAIVDACAAGDAERVAALIEEHLEQIATRLIGALRGPAEVPAG